MESTLQALGGILLKAVPTFILVLLLHVYLKRIFFRPLEKVLRERYEATGGARRAAEESIRHAASRTAEYEAAIRSARAEVYQKQEQLYRELQERHAAAIAEARGNADALVKDAQGQLARDAESAKATLAGEADALAAQIADTLLRRSAA